jgi:prepilin-type N-terminal cleavage/methylation domain-containing protein
MSATGDAGDRGATLLEAMVVLAIVGLISGLAFPNLARGLQARSLQHAARTLAGDLVLARGDAIRRGQPVTFAVSADGAAYGWTGAERRTLGPETRLAMSQPLITFDTDGVTGSAVTLTLRGPPGECRLTLDPATGRTRESVGPETRG